MPNFRAATGGVAGALPVLSPWLRWLWSVMRLDVIGSACLRPTPVGETALPDTPVSRRDRFTTGLPRRRQAEPVKSSLITP